jgi:predicted transcriptional regulator
MGRPTLPKKRRRTRHTYTILREHERQALDQLAERTGQSRSNILRQALLKRLQEERVDNGHG